MSEPEISVTTITKTRVGADFIRTARAIALSLSLRLKYSASR